MMCFVLLIFSLCALDAGTMVGYPKSCTPFFINPVSVSPHCSPPSNVGAALSNYVPSIHNNYDIAHGSHGMVLTSAHHGYPNHYVHLPSMPATVAVPSGKLSQGSGARQMNSRFLEGEEMLYSNH